jgi:hypothetical protein
VDELERVRATTDPLKRVRLATDAVGVYQEAIAELGRLRRDAVEQLRGEGLTLTEIAKRAGVSRARLSQLGTAPRAPERVLLSAGAPVTIAVDTKKDAERGGIAVPQEHTAALETLAKTARRLGLDMGDTEYIVPPGLLDLNRDGLVVVCGPRNAPMIGQMLASDDRYGFGNDDAGWYLIDRSTGEKFRSPEDEGEPGDYAYLGRLPRPDGQGHWLYMAGIHASGGAGAATYFDREVTNLFQTVRNNRWSCLVRCEYEPETHGVLHAELAAPIHIPGKGPARARKSGK